jgi:hypothetical protein
LEILKIKGKEKENKYPKRKKDYKSYLSINDIRTAYDDIKLIWEIINYTKSFKIMKIKFSQKDREALAKSMSSFENEKLVEALDVVGAGLTADAAWSRSSWSRSSTDSPVIVA